MTNTRLKPKDLFGVSVIDEFRSQVVCPDSLRGMLLTHLYSQGINCSLGKGEVTIGNETRELDVIVTEAGVNRVFTILKNYIQA